MPGPAAVGSTREPSEGCRSGSEAARVSALEDERPVCAIADVHGRADLLGAMLDAIERELPDARIVMLGDMIDRGPDVPGALALAMDVPKRFSGSTVLTGNHENWLVTALGGDHQAWDHWRSWGGRATLAGFGVDPELPPSAMREAFEERAPGVLAFLAERPRHLVGRGAAEGHLFVHAGVDPTVALDDQHPDDLIWIREPFLSWPVPLDRTVVHGHTIENGPVVRPHRIGLDTGAYHTGVLTCLVLEPDQSRRFLSAHDGWGSVEVEPVGPR